MKNLCELLSLKLHAMHPNIVKLHEVYINSKHRYYIVMDLCKEGELFDSIMEECFTETEAAHIVYQIASALKYIHIHGMIHGDLKPENILFKDRKKLEIQLVGCGVNKCVKDHDGPGTLHRRRDDFQYKAPEQLSQKKISSSKVDLWTLGVLTYELLCGYLPFYHEDRGKSHRLIQNGQFEFYPEEWSEISDKAKDLISNLLRKNPDERYNARSTIYDDWV